MTVPIFPASISREHLLEAGAVKVRAAIPIVHEKSRVRETVLLCVLEQDHFLRRDLSRYVFAKECAIRIDKQQKERYNNVVIDNDVII